MSEDNKAARRFQRWLVLTVAAVLILVFSGPILKGRFEQFQARREARDARELGRAVFQYRIDQGAYPESLQMVADKAEISPDCRKALSDGRIVYFPPDSPNPPGTAVLFEYSLSGGKTLFYSSGHALSLKTE